MPFYNARPESVFDYVPDGNFDPKHDLLDIVLRSNERFHLEFVDSSWRVPEDLVPPGMKSARGDLKGSWTLKRGDSYVGSPPVFNLDGSDAKGRFWAASPIHGICSVQRHPCLTAGPVIGSSNVDGGPFTQ